MKPIEFSSALRPPHAAFPLSRRDMLKRCGCGAGFLALAGILQDTGLLESAGVAAVTDPKLNPIAPGSSHFPAKAKSVIWLFMNGGPSQVDTWEYKPELERRD